MSYQPSDRSPISPSFTSNPFDKYATARGMLPEGIGGIGTGSGDRFLSRKKVGERKRVVRVVVAAFLVGFIFWFFLRPTQWGSSSSSDGQVFKAQEAASGREPAVGGGKQAEYIPPKEEVPIKLSPVGDAQSPDTPTSDSPVLDATIPELPEPQTEDTTSSSPPTGPVKDRRQIGKEKASFVMLIRNSELHDALESMKQIEDRFNRNYKYPWTFLNDVPFTDEFIRETTKRASGTTAYALIPQEHWSVPERIEKEKMYAAMKKMQDEHVIYGGSLSYRHMCRFNSGFFWQQQILDKYEWYWRVEPGIGFYCDVEYDPFEFLRLSGKKYGFTITLPEYKTTIPTLWQETVNFMKANPQYLHHNSSLQFLLEDKFHGKSIIADETEYNGCHFWSNFEIASLDLWRSEAYRKYFEHLDQAGGFFYERWGDAPVHSIAAALFLGTEQVHHFADMGYKHVPWGRCPQPNSFYEYAKCVCPFEKKDSFDLNGWSCQPRWWKLAGKEFGA